MKLYCHCGHTHGSLGCLGDKCECEAYVPRSMPGCLAAVIQYVVGLAVMVAGFVVVGTILDNIFAHIGMTRCEVLSGLPLVYGCP